MLKKMQAFFFLLVMVGLSIPVYGTNHYVDKNANGSNNGTSWNDAWESFSAINWSSVNPGDIIYISGGTDSTIYNEQLTISSDGVTISRSTDTGHNGAVILDGNNGAAEVGILSNANNIVVDGMDRTKFKIRGYADRDIQARNQDNQTFKNLTCYIDLEDMASAIYFYGQEWSTPPVFSNNYTVENVTIHQGPGSYSGQGNSDGMQIIGIDNVAIKHCNITLQNSNNTPHSDCIQIYRCKNVTIENNEFRQLETTATSNKQGLYITETGGVIKIRNNYFLHKQNAYGSVLGIEFYDIDNFLSDYDPLDSAIVTNNTIVTSSVSKPWPVRFHNATGHNYHGRGIFRNNIIYYSNIAGSQGPGLDTSVVAPNTVSNNIYWRGPGMEIYITYNRVSSKALSDWQSWGYDVNSYKNDPLLTGYVPSDQSNAKDNGLNLSGLGYSDDIEGTSRPQWNGWDIGAYEINQGGGVNNPPSQASNPSPAGGALNQATNMTLSWSCSDPDGDPLTYDVYFGTTTNPPLVGSNQSNTNYNPGQLDNNTTYYWKIVAKDNQGGVTEGPVWSFSTGDISDTFPPELVYAAISGNNQVIVTFSEEMDSSTLSNKSNYSINNGISVESVIVLDSKKEVMLITTDHNIGTWYTLTVINVKDAAGNLINPNKRTFTYHATKKYKYPIIDASGQWYQNFTPQKTIDGNPDTTSDSRWGGVVSLPDSIIFDLGQNVSIEETQFSFYRWNHKRIYNYSIMISEDGTNWSEVVSNQSSASMEWTIDVFTPTNGRYIKLKMLSCNESQFAGLWEAEILGPDNLTGVVNGNEVPSDFELEQNYPNPFNPTTTISFSIPSDQNVKIEIYNALGELVKRLVDNLYAAGNHSVTFNASALPSGVYIYRMESKSFTASKKMMLIK